MKKRIHLTKGFETVVDEGDYEMLSKYKWHLLPGINTNYARTTIRLGLNKRKSIAMHNMILGVCDKKTPVDHRDRDGLNNCRSNLRVCTPSENSKNKKGRGVSKHLGVSWHTSHKSWQASIQYKNKRVFLGSFKDEKQAAIAYNKAAIKFHGEFSNLNKIL